MALKLSFYVINLVCKGQSRDCNNYFWLIRKKKNKKQKQNKPKTTTTTIHALYMRALKRKEKKNKVDV